jgi:uridine kinase
MGLLDRLAETVRQLTVDQRRPTVAIDGPDAAGKTMLADRLAERLLSGSPVQVVRASIDNFQHPRDLRHRRGSLSADGYYLDAFDHRALRDRLLIPFRRGQAVVQVATFDYATDQPAVVSVDVGPRAVLLVDGVFLQHRKLHDLWSLVVYLTVEPAIALRRGVERDAEDPHSRSEMKRRYLARYLPGQQLYRADVDPETSADIVIANDEVAAPAVLRWDQPRS